MRIERLYTKDLDITSCLVSELLHMLAESAQIDDATLSKRDAEKTPDKHYNERMDIIEGLIEPAVPDTAAKTITCQPEVCYNNKI